MLFLKSSDNQTDKRSKIKIMLVSTSIAYILSLIMLLIFSLVIAYTNISESFLTYSVKITTYLSALVSGFICAGKIASKGWLSGAISGFCYSGTLIIISMLLTKTTINFPQLFTVLICIFSGTIGGIIGINTKSMKN